jgi:type III secretory pathway component EscR
MQTSITNNIDYKKIYDELVYEKISIQKEFEKYKKEQEEIVNKLTKDNEELKEHLKKYTSHKGNKNYYEKNKEKIIEHNKKAYHSKKLKKLNEKSETDNSDTTNANA